MFAVVQVGNSQYKVSEGDTIKANRLDYEKARALFWIRFCFIPTVKQPN